MKYLFIIALTVLSTVFAGCQPTKVTERNYAFEAYCDSIREADPVYYYDVLGETDEYYLYIEEHGKWWEE